MSDLGNRIKQVTEETSQTVEEIAKDVRDSVGEAIEQGFQSATGTPLTPQQIQQKQIDDQKKISETRRKIDWLKKVDEEQKMVRQANQQKETQRLQSQQQQKQVEVQKVQIQQAKEQKIPEEVLRSQIERKAGKGLGG